MSKHADDIIEFRTAARQPIRDKAVEDLTPKEKYLAFDLVGEELMELGEALGLIDPETGERADIPGPLDIVAAADAAVDLLYVVRQLGPTLGLDLDALWNEVHASNMSKADPETGYMEKNDDGKVIKPPTFFEPRLQPIIEGGVDNERIEKPSTEAGDVIVAPSVALAHGTIPISRPDLAQLSVITIPLAYHVTGLRTRNVYVMAGMKHEPKWPQLKQVLEHNQALSDSNGKFIDLNV